jgi:hypothetical protein
VKRIFAWNSYSSVIKAVEKIKGITHVEIKFSENDICAHQENETHTKQSSILILKIIHNIFMQHGFFSSVWKRIFKNGEKGMRTSSVGLDFSSQSMIAAGLLYGWYPLSTLIGCGGATWVAIESTVSAFIYQPFNHVCCWRTWKQQDKPALRPIAKRRKQCQETDIKGTKLHYKSPTAE